MAMEVEVESTPPPPYTRDDATYAQVSSEITSHAGPEVYDALAALRRFWIQQEETRFSSDQLKTLKSQGIYALTTCAKQKQDGVDISQVLPVFEKTFEAVTDRLSSIAKGQLETAIKNPDAVNQLELAIAHASEALTTQVRNITQKDDIESTVYAGELLQARERDRTKIQVLKAVMEQLPPNQNLNTAIIRSMEESLKIIRATSVGQERVDAKRTLAILADLTGQPLPPSTILDREFVTIGEEAIHQGPSYDIFKGEYFTGEEIAIKVLRHRVDAETAKRTHERFARQTIHWSTLRHDTIVPFYGAGVLRSPVVEDEFQLYVVSPYMRNQDVGRYLKKYYNTAATTRLQMSLDIVRGLKYMHSGPGLADGQGLVHSALNISNVLVKDSGHIVVSGFGHSKLVIEGRPETFTGDNSDYRYMGPEMLDEAVLSYGSDIWSWAMTSLEILTDEPPFGRKTKSTKVIQMIAANKRPLRADHPKIEEYQCKEDIWQLFEDCWRIEPRDRPSAREVTQRLRLILDWSEVVWTTERLLDPPISGNMEIEEVIKLLLRHGCPDITKYVLHGRCSRRPVAVGGFGDVYEGFLDDGVKVAIKCARMILSSDDGTRSTLKSAAREIYTCSKHSHRNVLNIYGLAQFQEQIALVTPWMDNGTVRNFIDRNPDAYRCKICTEIATGLAYLHGVGSVHGDLKGANILVSKGGVPKITDFGTSMLKKYTLGFTNQDMIGQFSLRWAAPELLDEGRASREADVYALGMTILEIITNKDPYEYLPDLAVIGNVTAGNLPRRPIKHIPERSQSGNKLWMLLYNCWAKTPTDRITAASAEHAMAGITSHDLRPMSMEIPGSKSPDLNNPLSWHRHAPGSLNFFAQYFFVMAQSCV